jgi:hypothetical protein
VYTYLRLSLLFFFFLTPLSSLLLRSTRLFFSSPPFCSCCAAVAFFLLQSKGKQKKKAHKCLRCNKNQTRNFTFCCFRRWINCTFFDSFFTLLISSFLWRRCLVFFSSFSSPPLRSILSLFCCLSSSSWTRCSVFIIIVVNDGWVSTRRLADGVKALFLSICACVCALLNRRLFSFRFSLFPCLFFFFTTCPQEKQLFREAKRQ